MGLSKAYQNTATNLKHSIVVVVYELQNYVCITGIIRTMESPALRKLYSGVLILLNLSYNLMFQLVHFS